MPDQFIAAAAGYDVSPRPAAPGQTGQAERARQSGARRVTRNASAVVSSQLLTWAASAATVFLLPRYLGDADFGKLTFAFGLTTMFGAVALFGVHTLIAREIAREPAEARRLVFNALLSRLPLLLGSALAMMVAVHLLGYPASTERIVALAAAWMAAAHVGFVAAAGLQGLERMTLTSALSVIDKLILAIFGLGALAFASAGVDVWVLVMVASAAVTSTVMIVHFWRVAGFRWEPDRRTCRTLLYGGAPFFTSSIAIILYGGLDIIMLSLMTHDEVVGWYGAAYRFINVPGFFAVAITTALLPAIVSAPRDAAAAMARRAFDIALLVTLPIAILLFVCASQIIHLLDYPVGFNHSIILLRILAVHVPLISISIVITTVLIAQNREKAWLALGLVAAVFNPLMNLAAIPVSHSITGNGAVGAAVVTVLTEAFIVGGSFALLGRGTFDASNVRVGVRCLGAGALMTVAALITYPLGIFAVAAASGITYALALLALRATTVGEVRELVQMVVSREAPQEAPLAA